MFHHRFAHCAVATAGIILIAGSVLRGAPANVRIRFNRDIRPILSDNCFSCHGSDQNERKADLRLDFAEHAYAPHKSGKPIVPRKPDASEVVKRITSADPDEAMPPTSSGKSLSPTQISLIREWIVQGAEYEPHWAFIVPTRPAVPEVASLKSEPPNPIDAFVLARLEKESLPASREADRSVLIRRLSFDLTGLPPSAEDAEGFVSTSDPHAYEQLVEQYLASPAYGERMAVHWLDLVRYADTTGFHGDCDYSVWPYRDYVIRAFNENMPFDQFTTEQLAGDLLPNATREQRVASGYNRLNRISAEAGLQDREYRVKYAADRVRVTSAVWMGATLGCAECHDHKFDPYSMKDFYRFAAFFADLKEKGCYEDGPKNNDWGPKLALPSPEQQRKLQELDSAISETKRQAESVTDASLATSRARWEKSVLALEKQGKLGWASARPIAVKSSGLAKFLVEEDSSVLVYGRLSPQEDYSIEIPASAESITGVLLESLTSDTLAGNEIARAGSTFFISEVEVHFTRDPPRRSEPVKIAWATADSSQEGYPVLATIDGDLNTAWSVGREMPRVRSAVYVFAKPVHGAKNAKLIVRIKHSPNHPFQHLGRFRLALSSVERPGIGKNALPGDVLTVIQIPPQERSERHQRLIARYYRSIAAELDSIRRRLNQLTVEREVLIGSIPTMLVSESGKPRTVRVLSRGNWMDETSEVVQPGVPHFLRQIENNHDRATRLDLADWLVASDNPLVARVFVNRLWKLFFGAGLSTTLEDLGSQGEWPTHAELLDWLACEFMRPTVKGPLPRLEHQAHSWDVKHLVRLIVTSRTYRQSSVSNPTLNTRDPLNRLVARQSRFRLEAEMIRDNALAASGLLVNRIGGPSVRPYQPEGLYAPLGFPRREYVASTGCDLYRRSLYTHWQRTFVHPTLMAFDAPSREECTAQRATSNTPLQALVLLNDPIYIEAARVFAENIIRRGGNTFDQRLTWAYQHALARRPKATEARLLSELHQKHAARFRGDTAAATDLIGVGEWAVARDLDPVDLAAWASVARAVLNLDETITRN